MDLSPIVAASGSVALFGAVAALLWRLLVLTNRRESENDARIKHLERENAWCNQRVSILIFACQRGGIEIPKEVWDGPPSDSSSRGHPRRRRTDYGRLGGGEPDVESHGRESRSARDRGGMFPSPAGGSGGTVPEGPDPAIAGD